LWAARRFRNGNDGYGRHGHSERCPEATAAQSKRLRFCFRASNRIPLGFALAEKAFPADKMAVFDAYFVAYFVSPGARTAIEKDGIADLVREYPVLN
jgi:hypothetical protein